METLLERRSVALDLTEATEADEEKDLRPSFRHGKVGVDVPPILLQEQEDGTYLVRDGHHRRLIAIANGETHIEAYIAPAGWQSPSGSPFPYYHRHGEASVEWQGQVYDYGDMWSGDWRGDYREDEDNCEMQYNECEYCNEECEGECGGASRSARHHAWSRAQARRECNRVECCGPFERPESQAPQAPVYGIGTRMELAGQLTLAISF